MRSYHALYNPPRRARRSKANPSRSRGRRPTRARVPRSRYPKLHRYLKKNPVDTVEEAVQLVKAAETDSAPKSPDRSRVIEMRSLSPLKYLLIKPGDVVEAMGDTWTGDDKNWTWVAFDTNGNPFERGERNTAYKAMGAARDAMYAAADPAIRAFASDMLGADAFGGGEGTLAQEKRDRAIADGFELQTYVPEGYETPLPGNYADRPVPNMPGYVIRVFARWDGPTRKKPGNFGDRIYYFQVLDPEGVPIGAAEEVEPKAGRVDIPDDALVAVLDQYTPNPSEVQTDSDMGIIGPFPTSLQANQVADVVAAVFSGERDVVMSNPAQRRKLVAASRRGMAKANPELTGSAQVWERTKKGAKGLGSLFGGKSEELVVKEGGVEVEELDQFDQMLGLPNNDPSATFRMGYYYGVLRGMNSCGLQNMFKRAQFRRQFQKNIIKSYNELAQKAISKDARRVRTVSR